MQFRWATEADVDELVALIESAYRGEASRQGWTTEADLLDGQRTDRQGVEAVVNGTASGMLVAVMDKSPDQPVETAAPQGFAPVTPSGALGVLVGDHGPVSPEGVSDDQRAKGACRDTSTIVGCCQLERRAYGAYLGMFAIRPGRQGQGWGQLVLGEAERRARAWQARELRMTVLRQRHELITWYERRGFHRTGKTEPFPYGDERFGLPRRDDLEFVVLAKSLGG